MTLKICLLLFLILPHSITPIDPGTSVDVFGTQISTSGSISRIEKSLYNLNSTAGNLIHFKQCVYPFKCPCLNVVKDWLWKPQGYGFSLQDCNSQSALQQWRLIGDQLLIGSVGDLPDITEMRHACLDCTDAADDCFMHIFACYNNNRHQQFLIRVHSRQIDLVKREIYFSIHLKAIPSKCITLFYDSNARKQAFKMDECEGSDLQSFRVNGDFSKELRLVKSSFEQQLKF